jgi:hypothetical protein
LEVNVRAYSLFVAVAIAVLAAASYLKAGRRHVLNWGATRAEAAARFPGDELLDDVAIQTTRAITIAARPSAIWPWLLQMGPKPRAGAYTYDWIERKFGVDIENSDRLLPGIPPLEPGQFLPLAEGREDGLEVKLIEAERALVLQWRPANSTWVFILEPQAEGTTRLISRNRIPGGGVRFWLGMVLAMEPGSLVMERKMLLGIKERAEHMAGATTGIETQSRQPVEA